MAISKQKAIELLKENLTLIDGLSGEDHRSQDFIKWRMNTKDLIGQIAGVFRSARPFPQRFSKISYGDQENRAIIAGLPPRDVEYATGLSRAFDLIRSLIKNLQNFESNDETTASGEGERGATPSGSDVFIVHGHDEGAKHKVARYVEQLGLTAIILDEQAGKGCTVIQKFEDHSKDVGFAVVLFTPDDVGKSVKEDTLKPRARQNVVFELGYFVAKLARNRVSVLYGKGVEMPSNYDGVLYISLEDDWRTELRKEITAAGIHIDPSKMI